MTSLLVLPNELLQHIACYLSCSALLKLIRVNRRLHDVCHDRRIYQFIAKNALGNVSGAVNRLHEMISSIDISDLSSSQLAWPEGDVLLQDLSLAKTIRVAYAADQSVSALCATDDEWTIRTRKRSQKRDISDWLPHMLALHHPVGWGLEPSTFLRLQGELSAPLPDLVQPTLINRVLPWSRAVLAKEVHAAKQQIADFINVNFILSYTALQRMRATKEPKEVIRLFEDFFFPAWLAGTHPGSWEDEKKVISDTIGRLCDRVPGYSSFTDEFTLVQATTVLPALIVQLGAQVLDTYPLGQLPIPAKIPFHTFMDIPAVFQGASESFSTCHIREMTTPEFLSGRWKGYYADQPRFLERRRFDPPMRDIRIVARPPTKEESTRMKAKAIIDRQSRGVDGHGEFSLEGRVRVDGLVRITKRYTVLGWSWAWCGRITPFGIVGVWGSGETFGGYFWIWNNEWC